MQPTPPRRPETSAVSCGGDAADRDAADLDTTDLDVTTRDAADRDAAYLDEVLTAARRAEPGWFRADLRVALLVLVGGLAPLAVGLAGLWSPDDTLDADRWWHALPLLAGAAVMLGKRRRPLLTLAAGILLLLVDASLGGSLGTVVVLLDLLYSAALYSSRTGRRVLLVTAWSSVGVAAALAGVASDGDPRAVVMGAIQAVGLVVVPLWWAANVRTRSELAVLADERADLARAHAEGLERIAALGRRDAVLAERRTMARDLHDVVAGHVSAIAIRTGAALAGPPGRERETLETVRASSLTALDEMRAMIVLLRADDRAGGPVSAPGTLDDLSDVVAGLQGGGVEIVLVDRAPRGLPAAVEQAALRIVQESLTNVVKHGAPGQVQVVLEEDDDVVEVRVVSPLRASPAPAAGGPQAGRPPSVPVPDGPGAGLLGMRERAEGLGGTLQVGAVDGSWTVRARLPRAPGLGGVA